MKEHQDEKVDRADERVEDLEVREDEARDIAGGKKKEVYKFGKKASGVRYAEPVNERKVT